MSDRFGERAVERAELHAFEPLPANITRLERNLALNSIENVIVHSMAVSDKAGEAMFYAPESRSSGTGRLAARKGLRPKLKVATATLDNLVAEGTISTPRFIKMDVEGAELRVLRGADQLLSSDNPPMMIFELNEELAAAFDSTPEDYAQLLEAKGYRTYVLKSGKLESIDLRNQRGHNDIFAFKGSHLPDVEMASSHLNGAR